MNRGSINDKLNKTCGNHDVIDELNKLEGNPDSWLWLVNELRNHSLHRDMLRKQVSMSITEDVNKRTTKNTRPVVSFMNPRDNKPMDMSAVEYLEESLHNMRRLIEGIRQKAGL